ncbi:PLP-dependent aminotransferase family protein [Brevibacillus sp. B_LB10_24]|uniref:MocR-like pyridoxine biosynthesis transcription factor PdxR n=1 Tax=Brevibacillus sp. B_LB10_24 TaxID=3380645 RepID=UPI0038B7CEF6
MLEMIPRIEETGSQPMYLQLYEHIKKEIVTGKIPAHTRLPSVRQLTRSLHVSKTTIELAYHQLVAEGYIESRERSGFFAVPLEGVLTAKTAEATVETQADKRRHSPAGLGEIRFNFHTSKIDMKSFPVNVWRRLSNQALAAELLEEYSYGSRQGEWGLRKAIADYLHHSRGVSCVPEQIIIGAGTQTVLGILCQVLKKSGPKVAVEDPGYVGARFVFERNGFSICPIALEADGLNLDELQKSGAGMVYVTPSHQYPYGMVMPIAKRLKLLQWAFESGGLIVEDDYDGEFRYHGKPIPSLQGLAGSDGNVVYVGTFSKSLLPSLRVSYMVVPAHLLEEFRHHLMYCEQTVSKIHQKTLQLFMETGEWERHLRRMRKLYQRKHDILLQEVKRRFGDSVRILGTDAGLHIMLEIASPTPADELVQLARQQGIHVESTWKSWLSRRYETLPPQILLGFGGMKSEEIAEGIQLLEQVWRPLIKHHQAR